MRVCVVGREGEGVCVWGVEGEGEGCVWLGSRG